MLEEKVSAMLDGIGSRCQEKRARGSAASGDRRAEASERVA